ncbi:MAG: rhomboid family intramembrane serine protease [Weeksellaceae bacterium]|nr:rhomboid family intramembrane serine protease [Weeksellaceae bacterium]
MFQNIPPITRALLIINALFFVAKFIAASNLGINLDLILGAFFPLSKNFQSYQIITHMFMHGDLVHFFFNMFALWMFGSTVERTLGEKKYFILYFLSGLGAFAIFNFTNYLEAKSLIESYNLTAGQVAELRNLDPFMALTGKEDVSMIYSIPMVGASGAIFGILVAFGMLFPNAVLMLIFPPIPLKAKYFIPIYIVIELYLAIRNQPGDNIAHFAHLGGALIGFLLIRNWKKQIHRWNG